LILTRWIGTQLIWRKAAAVARRQKGDATPAFALGVNVRVALRKKEEIMPCSSWVLR
jgi:hypothetical protein